jgi:hypothetical protein
MLNQSNLHLLQLKEFKTEVAVLSNLKLHVNVAGE